MHLKNEEFMKELSKDIVHAFAPALYPYIVMAFSSIAIILALQIVILVVLLIVRK
jgi:hypothetical protein